MQAVATDRRRSVMVMSLMLLAALMTAPSALAHGGGAAGQSNRSAPTQRFLAISTDPSDNAKPVVLGFGPIHAKGVDKAVNNHKDIFRFPAGSLVIRHQKVAGHRHHDPVTCLFRFSERGTYRVVRGTGDYAGAHGHGRYVLHGKFVACGQGAPDAFVFQIRAQGPLQL
jgi:hypothetical protein